MAGLGSLYIDLLARTGAFETDLGRAARIAERQSRDMQRQFAAVGKAVAAVGTASAVAFGALVQQSISAADRLSKLSQVTGVSTESLSQLEYAAGLSGSSLDGLVQGLGRLSRAAADAARGSQASASAFSAIGISTKTASGELKGTEDLLLEIADRFAQYEDGASKAAIAQELFGRSGVALIPFLNQGRAGIEALKKEADSLGQTIGTRAGKQAEAFNDNMSRLQKVVSGLAIGVANELLPSLLAVSEQFVSSAKEGNRLDSTVQSITASLKVLAGGALIIGATFQAVGKGIGAAAAAMAQLTEGITAIEAANPALFSLRIARNAAKNGEAAINIVKDGFSDIGEVASRTLETIDLLWNTTSASAEGAAQSTERLREALVFDDAGVSKAVTKATDQIHGMITALEQEIATFERGESEVIAYRIAHGDLRDTFQAAGDSADELASKVISLTSHLQLIRNATSEASEAVGEFSRKNEESLNASLELFSSKFEKEYIKTSKELTVFQEQAARNTQDIISNSLINGFDGGAKGILKSFGRMLAELSAQAVAADLAGKLFGSKGGDGSGWLGALFSSIGSFGGGKAIGGPLEHGKWYIAGEHGPEPIWGGGTGAFAMGYSKGGAAPITINMPIDARGATADAVKLLPQVAKQASDDAVARVLEMRRKGQF